MRADTTVALLVFLVTAAAAAVLAAPAVASHGDDANFTVAPEEPDPDRVPGERQATYDTWVEVDESYEDLNRVQMRLEDEAFMQCDEDEHLRAFGIDRGGTNPGIETDETPPPMYIEFDGSYFIYQMNESFDLEPGDEVVASFSDCLDNSEEEGWYQGHFLLHNQDDVQLQTKSHHYWICDCEDEAEARERLGPPPSETSSTPTSTSTPEPAMTSTPTETATSTPEPTATETAPSASTSTATSEPSGTQTSSPTEEATPTEDDDSASVEGTPTDSTADNESAVRTAEDQQSPSATDGHGFGVVAALIAIAAGALLARRR